MSKVEPSRRPKTGGRRKGTPNKTTRTAKEAIAYAADKLGGADRLVAWAKSDEGNEKAFWSIIYPKLLPLQVAGDADNPLHITATVRRIVDAAAN